MDSIYPVWSKWVIWNSPIWPQGQIEPSLTYGPSELLTLTADCLPQVGFKRTFVSVGSQVRSSLISVTLTHPREASQDDPDSGLPPRSKSLKLISIWRSAGASRYQTHFASFGNWLFRDLLTGLLNQQFRQSADPWTWIAWSWNDSVGTIQTTATKALDHCPISNETSRLSGAIWVEIYFERIWHWSLIWWNLWSTKCSKLGWLFRITRGSCGSGRSKSGEPYLRSTSYIIINCDVIMTSLTCLWFKVKLWKTELDRESNWRKNRPWTFCIWRIFKVTTRVRYWAIFFLSNATTFSKWFVTCFTGPVWCTSACKTIAAIWSTCCSIKTWITCTRIRCNLTIIAGISLVGVIFQYFLDWVGTPNLKVPFPW